MRFLLWAALPVTLFGQAGAVVDGTVVNHATRLGIAGVDVMMQSTARNGASYNGTTDATGAFHIEGIPDGDYRANFGKPGFVPLDLGRMMPPAPIHISAASSPVRVQLELAAFPKVTGRVVDGEGHPVPEAAVQVVHTGGGGRAKVMTDKNGVFVLDGLIPAAFVLRAVPPAKLPPPKSPADEPEIWAPTFYPSVTEQFRAQPMMVRVGEERVDCDIKLRAVPVFHVRGVVVDDDGNPVSGASVKLLPPDSLDARSHAAFDEPEGKTTAREDGTFEFSAIRPGEWFLMANGKRGAKSLSGVVTGTVTAGDWENIKLRVTTPFTVKGTVERPDAGSRHTWVALIPAWQTRLMGIHDEHGVVEIDDVVPGKYQILLEEPLPGLYVDSVQFGGRDVLGQTVDVMDASLRLRVVYKAGGGRVQGSVEHCSHGTVVLMPKEPALQNSELIRWGRCDAAGHFDIGSLRPGTYYAAAFDRLDDLSLYYGAVVDPALIAVILERGTSVLADGGQTSTIGPPLIEWPER